MSAWFVARVDQRLELVDSGLADSGVEGGGEPHPEIPVHGAGEVVQRVLVEPWQLPGQGIVDIGEGEAGIGHPLRVGPETACEVERCECHPIRGHGFRARDPFVFCARVGVGLHGVNSLRWTA